MVSRLAGAQSQWRAGWQNHKLSPETYKIDGKPQATAGSTGLGGLASDDMISLQWEGRALVTRFTLGEQKLPCLMKRYIKDELMVVRLMCEDFYATRIYAQVDNDGDFFLGVPPPRDVDQMEKDIDSQVTATTESYTAKVDV